MMPLREFSLVAMLCFGAARAAEPAGLAKPHILFLLADDLGWADVGFHGGEIKTPHIDALAKAGARLNQFYVQPVCSPTRAALMTGRYPIRYGLQTGVVRPWAHYGLPLDERTLPQALKEAGYATAIVGKWHLGHFEPAYLPTHRGFDRQYGHYNGALDYNTHERDGGHDWHRDDKVNRDEGYATHLLAREASRLISEHDARRPLFLYVPFNAVHSPFQVPARYTEPYAHMQGNRRLYAGMLAAMDEAIGRIVGALETKGLRDNTLIFFCSDNGGPAPGVVTSNGPLRASKGTLYEGGVRVPAVAAWTGRIKAGSVVDAPLHIVDWYPTLLKLAGVSLTQRHPLDGRDAWPAIAHGAPSPHQDILHNITPAGGAIRVGDWKLVVGGQYSETDGPEAAETAKKKKAGKKNSGGPGDAIELFNLAADPYEKKNLATAEPERVKAMRARLDAYAKAAVPAKQAPRAADFKVPAVWGEAN
ncbi:MAG: arylsulfatase [Opitutaceae bacterium]|nr:arylsulfatase [Opitutaceae bacterium]